MSLDQVKVTSLDLVTEVLIKSVILTGVPSLLYSGLTDK